MGNLDCKYSLIACSVFVGYNHFSPVVGIGTPPTPHPQASMPPPLVSGGRGTLAGERGGGRVPIPTRGHTRGTVLFIYMYFVATTLVTISFMTELVTGKA